MRKAIKILVLNFFPLILLTLPLFAFSIGRGTNAFFMGPPAPRLLYPITDEVNLGGKGTLSFRWTKDYLATASGYDFKLYKGYQMKHDALLKSVNLPAAQTTLDIKTSELEDNQVYTWALRQIGLDGLRSDWSFSSFKLIK